MNDETKLRGFVKRDMDEKLFVKIVDDLKEFPPLKVFNFHGMGESQLHPNFYELAHYATSSGIAERYEIRTNGSLLREGGAQKLVAAGLTRVCISVEAVTNEGYEKLTKRKGNMLEQVQEGVRDLYRASRGKCSIYAKIIDFNLPETDTKRFKELFSPIVDQIAIEYPEQWNTGLKRDTTFGRGVKVSVTGKPLQFHTVCPYPFYTLMVNVSGKVVVCCFDWSHQNIVGMASEESIRSIWNGAKMRDHWLMQLQGRSCESAACRDCTNIQSCPDDLDSSASELIKRLTQASRIAGGG